MDSKQHMTITAEAVLYVPEKCCSDALKDFELIFLDPKFKNKKIKNVTISNVEVRPPDHVTFKFLWNNRTKVSVADVNKGLRRISKKFGGDPERSVVREHAVLNPV